MVAVLAFSACSSSETRSPVAPRDTAGPDTTHGDTTGTVQRAELRVAAKLSPVDTALIRALGLSGDGRLVGVIVFAQRVGSNASVTATTDSSGTAILTDLLPGSYSVAELMEHRPAAAFEDLSDTDAVLTAILAS